MNPKDDNARVILYLIMFVVLIGIGIYGAFFDKSPKLTSEERNQALYNEAVQLRAERYNREQDRALEKTMFDMKVQERAEQIRTR